MFNYVSFNGKERKMSLENISTDKLKAELERRTNKMRDGWPDSPVGTWEVTTEGDVEGRTERNLGVFEGHIVDIALRLRKKCFYSLRFNPFVKEEVFDDSIQIGDEVSVVLDISSGTWDMNQDQRVRAISTWINKSPLKDCRACDVQKHNYFASVKIIAR